jgi:hypothetical protein
MNQMRTLVTLAKKAAIWIISIGAMLFIWLSIYVAGPVRGSVIEQDTGNPIEGAIVAIAWPADEFGWMGGISAGKVHLKETLTDEKGEFFFWPWLDFYCLKYSVRTSEPELIVAKSGFAPMHISSNRSTPVDIGGLVEKQGNLKLQFKLAQVKAGINNLTFSTALGSFSRTPLRNKSPDCILEEKSPSLKRYVETHDYSGASTGSRLRVCIQ